MCFQNSECMLYHRAAEGGDEESSGLERGVFDGKVGLAMSLYTPLCRGVQLCIARIVCSVLKVGEGGGQGIPGEDA